MLSFYKLFLLLNTISLAIFVPSCKVFSNFCEHCNILTNICAKCQYSDVLVPDENGGCMGAKKCILGKNNCNECDLGDHLCISCEKNYYPDENGGCTYSEGCEISYMGECIKCKDGYILLGKESQFKICRPLSLDNYKNCLIINSETGYCSECNEGYFLTSLDYKCIEIENCAESIYGNCISCNQDYFFNKKEGKCELKESNLKYCKESLDGINCEICEKGYYFDDNGICVETQFCEESENLECKKCKSGYYLAYNSNYNGYSCTNTDNCQTADTITSICTVCNQNYYLNLKDYKCRSNLEDGPFKYCKTVQNDQCIICDYCYFLGEDLKCSDSYYCAESENGKCLSCQKNYHLGLDNRCSNVEKCIYSEFSNCLECEDGYYYNRANNSCIEMENQFLNCKSSYGYPEEDKCFECKNGFYLFKNDSLCYDNTKEERFIKCAEVDFLGENCNDCQEGYYLGIEDNKCSKVENCKITKNENECLECDTSYCLDVKNQICVDNDYLNEFNEKIHISCNRTNAEGTACEQCINGYELNEEGYCVDIDICEEKKEGKCLKCKDIISPNGYKYCANQIFGCLEIGTNNCLRCDDLDELYECTECKEGYKKAIFGCEKIASNDENIK